LRTLGTGAQQACAGNDPRLVAPSPIGAIVAYSGNGDPPETDWLVADGRLIDRTTYAEFYNRTGHAYNGGVDPGGNKVRIPDKRGKKSVGAINMGTGAGPADNAHLQAARGSSYGEVNHALTAGESGVNGNGSTVVVSTDHYHNVNGGTAAMNQNQDHYHSVPNLNGSASHAFYTSGSGGTYTVPGQAPSTNTSDVNIDHAHGVNLNSNYQSQMGFGNYQHAHGFNARNADNVHNNIDPCEADSYIVRVL
jgi:microcystin-dependent protein